MGDDGISGLGLAISRREWQRAIMWALAVLALTSLPYLVGWLRSTPELQFGGIVYDLPDAHSYLAKMQQGAQGAWLLRLPHTPEPHAGGPFYLFYLLLGKLTRVFGWSMACGYQLARIACGLLLLLIGYRVISLLTSLPAVRFVAYLTFALGSGFGWLYMATGLPRVLGHMPLDLWSPDGFAFVVIYASPHTSFSQAMLLWALYLGFLGIQRQGVRYWIGVCVATLLASVVHPYMVGLVGGILGVYAALSGYIERRVPWREWALTALVSIPSALYVLWATWVSLTNPVFAAWRRQDLYIFPSPVWVVMGYGLMMILAVLAIRRACRTKVGRFAVVWAGMHLIAIYVPFNFGRRLISGFQLPLSALASVGLVQVFIPWLWRVWPSRLVLRGRYSRKGLTHLIVFAATLLTMLTNLIRVGGGVWAVVAREPLLFHTGDQLEAIGWLDDHAERGDVVLASLPEGNFVPTRVALHVVLGLHPETIDFDTKDREVRAFYSDEMSDAERRALLMRYRVRYVLHGPSERALGSFDPQSVGYLELVAAFDTYWIYEVTLSSDSPSS